MVSGCPRPGRRIHRSERAEPRPLGPGDGGESRPLGRARTGSSVRGETEPGPSGITFISDDIQADYERMRHKGAEFPLPPEKMEWGEWLGKVAHLDANVFDLK